MKHLGESFKAALSLAGVAVVWWAIAKAEFVNPELFPGPHAVWLAAVELHDDGLLYSDLRVSLGRAATGFIIGSLLGVIVGLLTARTRLFGVALNPLFTLLRPIPAIALVPLAIVWFGIGEPSKYFVISYTVFLAVWLNTHHGTSQVALTYIRASRSLGASRAREFFEVVIPAAAPHIVAGLRMGAALAFLSLVAAELTGASAGIGFRLQEARQFIRTDRMFVGLIELGILGALLDLFFVVLSRKLVHWEHQS
ncbi:MAG: ABC transporter permease [Betaproteobacteria bacterium]|nr:ABC transporter permease [Betaproteobacteria bacterium]